MNLEGYSNKQIAVGSLAVGLVVGIAAGYLLPKGFSSVRTKLEKRKAEKSNTNKTEDAPV